MKMVVVNPSVHPRAGRSSVPEITGLRSLYHAANKKRSRRRLSDWIPGFAGFGVRGPGLRGSQRSRAGQMNCAAPRLGHCAGSVSICDRGTCGVLPCQGMQGVPAFCRVQCEPGQSDNLHRLCRSRASDSQQRERAKAAAAVVLTLGCWTRKCRSI